MICLIIIVALTSIVIAGEEAMNKDIIQLRMNITIIFRDTEENCSNILNKHPNIKNLLSILSSSDITRGWPGGAEPHHLHFKLTKLLN